MINIFFISNRTVHFMFNNRKILYKEREGCIFGEKIQSWELL